MGQGQREAVQVAMMRWGVKEECEARRGQSAVALLSSKLSPPRPVSRQSHVLNLTKFGFAVRASRAGHVHHSRTS